MPTKILVYLPTYHGTRYLGNTSAVSAVPTNTVLYRTAVTLGQKINILGAAQKKETKVENLPNCPNGYKLLIKSQNSICTTENTENANNCPLPKFSNGSKFKFPVAQLQKWTQIIIGQNSAQASRPYGCSTR
jgi:hypothetical protein